MLNFIPMPQPKTCSVCCVVMLSGKSFAAAMKYCFDQASTDFSMTLDQMEAALNRTGLKTHQLEETPRSSRHNLLIECKNRKQGYWHYIAYDASTGHYLDPIPDPPPLEEYDFYRSIEVYD